MANFVKRLNKGTNNQYKGKFLLICFNFDGIGQFSNKFPHKKNKRNNEYYSNRKETYKGKKKHKESFQEKLMHQIRHLLIR
jgi:hypothetical protein